MRLVFFPLFCLCRAHYPLSTKFSKHFQKLNEPQIDAIKEFNQRVFEKNKLEDQGHKLAKEDSEEYDEVTIYPIIIQHH